MNNNISLKQKIEGRQEYNRSILVLLSDYIEKYPELRFGQLLCNFTPFNKDHDPFYDESYDTLEYMENLKNKHNY